jgi:hypothetical protein
VSPSTYLAPSSCVRNRPPQSQVACKLTPFAPPFTPPLPNPNPNCSAPNNDDLGNIPALAIRNSYSPVFVFKNSTFWWYYITKKYSFFCNSQYHLFKKNCFDLSQGPFLQMLIQKLIFAKNGDKYKITPFPQYSQISLANLKIHDTLSTLKITYLNGHIFQFYIICT